MNVKISSAKSRSEIKAGKRKASLVLSAAAAFVLSSCAQFVPGLSKLESATLAVYPVISSQTNFDSGSKAFATLVYPLITESRCMDCHTSQQPTIGASDINVAYSAAKTRLSLSNPSGSVLISKSQDGHCGGCTTPSKSVWTTAVERWAQSEIAAGPSTPGIPTVPGGPLPTPTPTVDVGAAPVFVTPAIQLTGAGGTNRVASLAGRGADFNAVSILYDLQDPYQFVLNSARVFNLRLRNLSSRHILVRGIRVFQSADAVIDPLDPNDYKSDLGAAFIDVDQVVAPNATIRLSVAEALMSKDGGLYFAFGFQVLEATNAPTCKAQAVFNSTVSAMLTGKCLSCHNTGGSGAGAWLISADAATRCGQSLQRSDLVTPNASKLIQYPFYRQNAHPGTSMTQGDLDSIINWITLER